MKLIDRLVQLPKRKRKIIVGVVLFICFLIGVATYGLWGSFELHKGESFFSQVGQTIQQGSRDVGEATQNTTKNILSEGQDELDQLIAFETDLSPNEFLVNQADDTNDVTLTVRKLLLDPDQTVIWISILNGSEDPVTFSPQTGSTVRNKNIVYLPKILDDDFKREEFSEAGQVELINPVNMEPGDLVEGYIFFDTVPNEGFLNLQFEDFQSKINTDDWSYEFLFDIDDLRAEKAAEETL